MTELLHLVRFVLILWGLVYIVTQSSIFAGFRQGLLQGSTFFGTLVFCPACTGFWMGLLLGVFGVYGSALSWVPRAQFLESALTGTVLGHFWGIYFGDPFSFQRAVHSLHTIRGSTDTSDVDAEK